MIHLLQKVGANDRLRVVVLGYLVRGPLGGLAWHHLQYVMGLAQLGHEAYFLEDSDDYPSNYDPSRHVTSTDPAYGLEFAARTFDRLGLPDRWGYYDAHTTRWLGPSADRIRELSRTADLILNVSGMNPLRPWFEDIRVRALIDTDPVFTQIRHRTDPAARQRALQHTAFFSYAENIGLPYCTVPDDELPWQPTRQPIVLDAWPVTRGPANGKFSTVMQWQSYRAREYQGRRYGMKADTFWPYVDLPQKAGQMFELAIGSASAPREMLRANGWILRDPLETTRDPWAYQDFIQQSKGEFSVAKHGYVVSRCGWFSERSACYLASGRPVLLQDTGFSDWLESGVGVIPFETPDAALAGLDQITSQYESHCRAARDIAEDYFDARRVLQRVIACAFDSFSQDTALRRRSCGSSNC